MLQGKLRLGTPGSEEGSAFSHEGMHSLAVWQHRGALYFIPLCAWGSLGTSHTLSWRGSQEAQRILWGGGSLVEGMGAPHCVSYLQLELQLLSTLLDSKHTGWGVEKRPFWLFRSHGDARSLPFVFLSCTSLFFSFETLLVVCSPSTIRCTNNNSSLGKVCCSRA
jgi:hypothetical protein